MRRGEWCETHGHARKENGICSICGDGRTPEEIAEHEKYFDNARAWLRSFIAAIKRAAPPQ